jgi:hypothetical protein
MPKVAPRLKIALQINGWLELMERRIKVISELPINKRFGGSPPGEASIEFTLGHQLDCIAATQLIKIVRAEVGFDRISEQRHLELARDAGGGGILEHLVPEPTR